MQGADLGEGDLESGLERQSFHGITAGVPSGDPCRGKSVDLIHIAANPVLGVKGWLKVLARERGAQASSPLGQRRNKWNHICY